MTAAWTYIDSNPAMIGWLATFGAVVILAALWVHDDRSRARGARREARERFTPDVEAAIVEALAVAGHVDDNPAAEYAVAALRRDLDEWGSP